MPALYDQYILMGKVPENALEGFILIFLIFSQKP